MKYSIRFGWLAVAAACILSGCSTQTKVKLDANHPVSITVWHYYNGEQKEAFSKLVQEFNATVGMEQGIQVQEYSQGSVTDLENGVIDAAEKKVGAEEMPNLVAAYADTAYALDKMGVVEDLLPYFNEKELETYLPAYIEEGYFAQNEQLKIFPIAKSTEIMILNDTDWQKFANETGAQVADLATIEGVTQTAQKYYEWTDAKTPDIPNDGKAFFGRDAFANYMLIGAKQLGVELFQVENGVCTLDFDRACVKKLWDNYYVPMVAGWFDADNRFRSDDIKMGKIIACVSSNSSATFFPENCVVSDTESYPITIQVLQAPEFANGQAFAVQQGAGMVVTKDTPEKTYASVVFLKWMTETERNAIFAVQSGYLPVTKDGSTTQYLTQVMQTVGVSEKVSEILTQAVKTTENNTMYTPKAFSAGSEAREILNTAMPRKAAQDRAAFLQSLQQGASYTQTLAEYTSDANFDAWYLQTKKALEDKIADQ